MELGDHDEAVLAAAASPFKIKTILVPVDFSDCSRQALKYALPLAGQHDATVALLYVIPTPPYAMTEYGGVDFASIESELRANSERQLAALVKEEAQDVKTETMVCAGSPGEEIILTAKSLGADLIVISTHGRTGLKHVFLGSVAEHVVRHAPCPVLVVREPSVPSKSKTAA